MRADVQRIDAVLFTHHHFDHVSGFDDLRAFNFLQRGAIPIYMNSTTHAEMARIFDYVFAPRRTAESSVPMIDYKPVDQNSFTLGDIEITPIPLLHGSLPITGYRIGSFAYCTDCNQIPEAGYERLDGVEVLILDALRRKPHPTHFSLDEAIKVAQRIGAKSTWFTHIAHDLQHARIEEQLPTGIRLAYDGLRLNT